MSSDIPDPQESTEIPQTRRWERWGNYPAQQNVPAENLSRLETHTLRSRMQPRTNPTDFSISLRAKYGTDQQIVNPGSKRRQSMRGFEDTYVDEGYVTSTRWHIIGTHRGWGFYGPPTGRRIVMWGITQHLIEKGKILEEWMTFNEFDVM